MIRRALEWEEKYSVGVEEINNQHKNLFKIINSLLDAIENNSAENNLGTIINGLIDYKIFHVATEEKYFKKFNYDGTEAHVARHKQFNDKLNEIKAKYSSYTIEFAYELIDFLEDWLINHLMTMDQKYVKCFHEHGLK